MTSDLSSPRFAALQWAAMNAVSADKNSASSVVYTEKLAELLRLSEWPALRRELLKASQTSPDEKTAAQWAVLALQAGLPELCLQLAPKNEYQNLLRSAAFLRLGECEAARPLLSQESDAEHLAMLARLQLLAGENSASSTAQAAYAAAFESGNLPALTAASVVLAEIDLRFAAQQGAKSSALAAVHLLGEVLDIAAENAQNPDPHALSLVALGQHLRGKRAKAAAAAYQAKERALAFSPAMVLALALLGSVEEAKGQAEAGGLHSAWYEWSGLF